MKVSFVLAVYNNYGTVTKSYTEISEVMKIQLPEYSYEIIFVNDGSTDCSWDEILDIAKMDSKNVKGLSFTRNFGQLAAIQAGFKEAEGDIVINISADLQDPISLVPNMIEEWKKGSKIVICNREKRNDGILSSSLSVFGYKLLRLANPEIPKGGFDYVLLDKSVLSIFNNMETKHRFFQGDILWAGFKPSLIPYERLKREIGKSQFNFLKRLKYFIDAFLDSSYAPIRFISIIGSIIFFSGFLYSLMIIYNWFINKTPFSGWAPLMIVILFLGGVIIFSLGILGEYLWRIYDEVRKKPSYIIKEKI